MGAYEASAVQLGPSQAVSMDTVSPNNAATTYIGVTGSGASTRRQRRRRPGRCPGIINGLICQVNTAPGAGNAWTIRLRVNAVDAALTCTITDPAVECEDLTECADGGAWGACGLCPDPHVGPRVPDQPVVWADVYRVVEESGMRWSVGLWLLLAAPVWAGNIQYVLETGQVTGVSDRRRQPGPGVWRHQSS